MNEELKIIIKAITSDAKKKIDEVKKKLEDTEKSGKKSGKGIAEAMAAIKKGALIAVGAITAITTALVAFGKSTLEAQKEMAKLDAAFISAGSSAAQAKTTYKELYRFMGDSGAATEAAQSLAALTTNQKELAEWTKILQGAYAEFGSTLPTESLAEAINHTAQLGEVQGTAADAFEWKGIKIEDVNARLATMTTLEERELFLRSTLNSLYGEAASIYEANNQALLAHNESQARLTIALAQAGNAVMPLLTAINNLSAALLKILTPAFQIVSQIILVFVEWIVLAIQWVSAFFSFLTGKGGDAASSTKAIANDVGTISKGFKVATGGASGLNKGLNAATKAAKELKKQTMGFDELNVVSSPTESAGASGAGAVGGGGAGIEIPGIASTLEELKSNNPLKEFKEDMEVIKEKAKAILTLIGLIGAGFLAGWLYINYYPGSLAAVGAELSKLKNKLKFLAGDFMAIAGAIMLVVGYSDAWANGLDWGNFALIIGGVALLISGIAISFGSMVAACAAVGAGIALVVLAIKDLVNNGFSWEAMILLVIGVMLTLTAAVWAFNAALLANPITWIVIAIAGLVAAIAVCIIYWDDVKAAAINAWNKTKEIWEKVAAWFNEKVIQPMANFFTGLWTKITEAFGKTKEWFTDKFQQAWDGIKGIWDKTSDYFSGVWGKITDAFGNVKTWFKEKFSDAWQAIKDVFSNFGSFFSGLWETIKSTFTNLGTKIGDAIGGAVKSGINAVIGIIERTINNGIGLINGAINLINKLPGVRVGKLDKLTLPRLAKGGIVSSTTIAMIGEAGKEAVLPLENNTQWMDRLADRITQRNSSPSKIVLTLDGKELGWASINSINNITKQSGSIPLVIM